MNYTEEQKEKFRKHFEDILKKIEQRDELEAKLYDWYLLFVEADGTGTPESTLKFKRAKLEKLIRMRKRFDKQIAGLRPEIDTLAKIVRNRAESSREVVGRDYANGSDPKDVPNV